MADFLLGLGDESKGLLCEDMTWYTCAPIFVHVGEMCLGGCCVRGLAKPFYTQCELCYVKYQESQEKPIQVFMAGVLLSYIKISKGIIYFRGVTG